MVKSSEFVQQGRFKDFDIDVWNKQIKDLKRKHILVYEVKTPGKRQTTRIRNILNWY